MSGIDSSLEGIRVLSMAEQYPGPLCTQLLGDLGADVIQLERPGGDPQRSHNEWLFRAASLGKRSVEMDLKAAGGLAAAKALVAESSVFVEGFRPGVADRLGLGFEALRAVRPALVYCSISGYGQTGPYRLLAGHNVNYEAVTGVLDPVLRPELDVRHFAAGPPLGDIASGMLAALGIVSALRSAERDGEAVYLDISIADSLILALAPNITRSLNGQFPWPDREPAYGVFACADGALALGISYEDHFWAHLCSILGLTDLDDLSRSERMSRRGEIRERVQGVLARQPVQHWIDRFGDLVPCSLARRIDTLESDPQMKARELIVSAQDEQGRTFRTVASAFARTSAKRTTRNRVPALGSSNRELLGEPPSMHAASEDGVG